MKLLSFFGLFLSLISFNLHAKESIVIHGSSTLYNALKKATVAFNEKSSFKVRVKGGGSLYGIRAAQKGGIGMISRNLSSTELKSNFQVHKIGTDGIAIIVHSSNKIRKLTTEQLINIYTGQIKNWSEVGGQDEEISPMGPTPEHGTYEAFLRIIEVDRKNLAKTYRGHTSHLKTISYIKRTKNSIGVVPLGQSIKMKDRSKTKALEIDGKGPTIENVVNKTYPLIRPLQLITSANPTKNQLTFIKWVSTTGQGFIKEENYVPLQK